MRTYRFFVRVGSKKDTSVYLFERKRYKLKKGTS